MKWLGKFFKKLWSAIRKILAVILIIVAIVIAVWATLITGGAALPLLFGLSSTMMYVVAGLCLVGAFIIDSDTSKKVTGKIGTAVGEAAEAIADTVGSAMGGALTGIAGAVLNNPVLMIAGAGILIYFLASSGKDKPKQEKIAKPREAKAKALPKPVTTGTRAVTTPPKYKPQSGELVLG